MSLARIVSLTRPRALVSLVPRRHGSSTANEEHVDHEESYEYRREGFSGPFWRNTVLAALLVAAGYKYGPAPTDDAYLTRWISLYSTPRELWMELATRHTTQSLEQSQTRILISDARKPAVHRYRYPQMFEQKSPFLTPVGMDVDTTKFLVKRDKE